MINSDMAKKSAGWWLFLGICLFGVLSLVNQLMPFWFNVLFIGGSLVALWLLPKPKQNTSTEDSKEKTAKKP